MQNKITETHAYRIWIRKRACQPLADSILQTKSECEMPSTIRDSIRHERMYRPIALDKYSDIIQYYLNRDIAVREVGIIIQPYLFWLTASSAGLVSDRSVEDENVLGLVEIKCPKSKRHSNIAELLNDPSFYIKKEDGYILLKKDHPDGIYAEIQIAMGLSGVKFCDLVVFVFAGLLIVRTQFDEAYFVSLVYKLNDFYKEYMLPKIVEDFKATSEL